MSTIPTFISVILDETGSMRGQEKNVIDSTNEYITGHREIPECYFNLLKFDAYNTWVAPTFNNLNEAFDSKPELDVRVLCEKQAIKDVDLLTEQDYNPRGMTNLYDAVGTAVTQLETQVANLKESNVILVINTDGQENASKEYTAETIKTLLKDKQENHNWQVIFLGADLSKAQSSQMSASMGISSDMTFSYSKCATRSVHSDLTAASTLYASAASSGSMSNNDIKAAFTSMDKYK
ncbi:von Willebrand factor type A [Vibrio phage 2.275.O._10N.286.54.E11]|nr:von Willebrand factor type A [Vibrio phage 2.275.O._10N.286.54.E11]